jgi:hypothetical protein
MDVEKAASIFVGTILIGFTCITTAGVIVLINNMFARWWKPVQWASYPWTENGMYAEPMHTAADPVKPN